MYTEENYPEIEVKTFVNSQHNNTNSKNDFVLKNQIQTFGLKISGIQK